MSPTIAEADLVKAFVKLLLGESDPRRQRAYVESLIRREGSFPVTRLHGKWFREAAVTMAAIELSRRRSTPR